MADPEQDEDQDSEQDSAFDEAFTSVVDAGNRLTEDQQDVDPRDIADGLFAGAVQFWLYSYQPCSKPGCEECEPIETAEQRVKELERLLRQFAEQSEYFHAPTDRNVGRA